MSDYAFGQSDLLKVESRDSGRSREELVQRMESSRIRGGLRTVAASTDARDGRRAPAAERKSPSGTSGRVPRTVSSGAAAYGEPRRRLRRIVILFTRMDGPRPVPAGAPTRRGSRWPNPPRSAAIRPRRAGSRPTEEPVPWPISTSSWSTSTRPSMATYAPSSTSTRRLSTASSSPCSARAAAARPPRCG